jgi:hypothetical protein
MKKDSYWFSHDSTAKDDPKSMKLIDQLGLEGYGIYWVLIETLRGQADYRYPLEMLPILARRYNTSGEKMKAVVGTYNLFVIDEDNYFFSLSLNDRMERMDLFREKRRIAGRKSGEIRLKKSLSASTHDEHMPNTCSTPVELKEKKRKENIIKDNKRKEDKIKDEKTFIPPSLSEVIFFFKTNGYSEAAATKAFNCYDLSDWIDTKGNQVKNWKQKMNNVWFTPEHLDKPVNELVPPPIPEAHAKR